MRLMTIAIMTGLTIGCSQQSFNGVANSLNQSKDAKGKPSGGSSETDPSKKGGVIDGGEITLEKCSVNYQIPATANIYFAGSPSTASLRYNFSKGNNTDLATTTSPVEIKPTNASCLTPGARLSFDTTGTLSHGGNSAAANSPEGNGSYSGHALGAQLGKSDIVAPMISMVAVFIGAGDPSANTAPARLDFTSSDARNYKELAPKLGQVFFVGDGKTDSGTIQAIIVPEGATRLYMGVWDVGQWNNNTGSLNGAINEIK